MRYRENQVTVDLQRKVPLAYLAIFVLIGAIVVRLFYLQIEFGEHYAKLATQTVVREEEVVARRGDIFDRNKKLIADSRPSFDILVIPQDSGDVPATIAKLAKLIPLDVEEAHKRWKAAQFDPGFLPVPLAEDVPAEWVYQISERLAPDYDPSAPLSLPGVSIRARPIRRYLYPELFGHALGYLREIDRETLKKDELTHPGVYSRNDDIGASGVEQAYDVELKGIDGKLGRIVDARGREIKSNPDLDILAERATVPPASGNHLITTLDFAAQTAAAEAFAAIGKHGAAVALDPRTGEVLVLYSAPGYDPNRITGKIDKPYWAKINLDPEKYLYNRALQAMYPQASTYKPVALTAALTESVIDPETARITCRGGMSFGNRVFRCWNHGGHGTLDAIHGLSLSCDVFFYTVGLKLGVDRLAEYASLFGYGRKTGIEIPFESAGLVPSTAWKQRRYKQQWYESETLSVSIGQGYNLATPLQNAKMVSMIANGGYEIVPHLGHELLSNIGEPMTEITRPKMPTKLIGQDALKWVQKGMIEVVHGVGTAKKLALIPYKIAGKTGTAQVVGAENKGKIKGSSENNALFVGFAPYDDPQIAVSIMVEHGGGGSVAAAPIAGKIIQAYLSQHLPKPSLDQVEQKPADSGGNLE